MFWRYKWKFRNSTEIRALDSLLPTASNVCAILVSVNVSSVYRYWSFMSLQAATRSDSMTLTPGPWLGLPAVTAVTLYRHEDPALVGWHHFQRNWKSAYCDHFCDIFWWSSGVLGIMFVQLPHCSASLYCLPVSGSRFNFQPPCGEATGTASLAVPTVPWSQWNCSEDKTRYYSGEDY